MKSHKIAVIGIIASLYAVLTIALAPISYAVVQVRIADALMVLPYLFGLPAAFALGIGCAVANTFGGLGLIDIVVGSIINVVAGVLTWKLRKFNRPILAPLPPVLLCGFVVGGYLHILFNVSYWYTSGSILIGETIACYGLGYPLLISLKKKIDK